MSGDLKDGVGIENSGECFVDLILYLGPSVHSLLVVVLGLVDRVKLKKEALSGREEKIFFTFFTSSICF